MNIKYSGYRAFPPQSGRAWLLAVGMVISSGLRVLGQNTTTPAAEPASATPPAKYTLNLSPPNVVGQKFGLVADESEKMDMQIKAYILGIRAADEKGSEITTKHFEAEAEVLEVFPNGSIKKIAYTVVKLQLVEEGNTTNFAPGAKIVAEAVEPKPPPPPKEKTTVIHGEKGRTSVIKTTEPPPPPEPPVKITIDGHPANKKVFEILEGLVGLGDGKRNRQEEAEPPGPVAVGDSWPVKIPNLNLFPGGNGKGGGGGSPVPLKATAKLEDIQGTGDQQVTTISTHFALKDFSPTFDEDIPIDSLNCSAEGNGTDSVPAVRTAGVEKHVQAMQFTFQAKGGKLGLSANVSGSGEMKSTTVKTYREEKPDPATPPATPASPHGEN